MTEIEPERALHERPRYHRGDWGTSAELAPDLWRVRLTNPRGRLMVNTYAWRGAGELIVLDPGWPWTLEALERALSEIGLADSLAQITHWVYTHTHIDHMGAAAMLGWRSEAPHLCWSAIGPDLERWHSFQDRSNDWTGWARRAFSPPQRQHILERMERSRRSMVEVLGEASVAPVRLFELGEVLELGGLELEVIDARGHDPRHVALLEPQRRWLFAGDAVLAVPTPISEAMEDDLGLYEQTLARLGQIEPGAIFPGHGAQILGTEACAEALARSRGWVDHYRERARRALGPAPRSLWEIALAATPGGEPLEPAARWHVHLALIDSHLRWLAGRGEARRVEGRWVSGSSG